MKALRIAQLVLLVLVAVYLVLFHSVNPEHVRLPLLLSMPPALVVVLTAAIAWLAAWAPSRARIWSLERRVKRAEADLLALSGELEQSRLGEPSAPVIPDREVAAVKRGDDPTDYL